MKKLLLITLVMVTALAGCGKKKADQEFVFEYVDEGTAEAEAVVSSGNKAASGTVDAYVESQYSNEGTLEFSFEETDSYTVDFSYNVPKINDVSDDAKTINTEIYDLAKADIENVEAQLAGTASEPLEPMYSDISYEAYLNGEILSIVVKLSGSYSDWVEYGVYNYNVSTQTRVKNSEILEAYEISKDDFLSKAKKSLGALALPERDFDEAEAVEVEASEEAATEEAATEEAAEEETQEVAEDPSADTNFIADFLADYVRTVSDKNVNTDMKMFIDADGEINVVGLVYVPAGAGQYYNVVKLEDKSNDAMLKKYCDYAEAHRYPGMEKALLGLWGEEGYQGSIVRKITVSNMSSEDVYIGFDSADPTVFTMQFYGSDYSNVYTGTLNFDSIDENGLIFTYELTANNGVALNPEGEEAPHSGKFYFNPYRAYDGEEETIGAVYKFIDGEDMLASDGYNVDFKETFG